MPIQVKKPIFRSVRKLDQFLRLRQADTGPGQAYPRALDRLGSMISSRAEQLQQQRDAAVVGDMYNQWRDSDREQLDQLLAQKGKDAINLGQSYDEFFNKSQSDISEEFENSNQQRAFTEITSKKRDQNLNILARYQAQEGQRYNKEVEAGLVSQAEQDVRGFVFDDDGVKETIADLVQWVRASNPGQDTTALEKKYTSGLLYANMQERIDQDPDAALQTLEEWKGALGEGYHSLKKNAEKASKEKLVEDLRDELNEKHTDGIEPNFNNMEDEISKDKTIPDDVKDSVIVWIRSQEREYEARESQRKNDTQDEEMDAIFGALNEGNTVGAYRFLLDASEISESQKFRIGKLIKSQEDLDGPIDAGEAIEITKRAMSGDATRDEIIDEIGKSIKDPAEGRRLLDDLREAEKPEQDERNRAVKDAADALEKQIVKGNQMVGYDTKSVDDAYLAVKDFEKQIANPPEGATVFDMLDPNSEYYIMEDLVRKYTVPFDEQIRRMTDKYRVGEATARKEDESISDYEKRVNE